MHTVGPLRSYVAITAGLLLVSAPLTTPAYAYKMWNLDICQKPYQDYYYGKSWIPCKDNPLSWCKKDGCCCVRPDSEMCKKAKDIVDGKTKCDPFGE